MLGNNKLKVEKLVAAVSKRFQIKIVKFANVGNHIYLVVKLPLRGMASRKQDAKWIRILPSRLAFEIGGSKKGEPFKDGGRNRTKFWDAIPFSRVIHGRRGWTTIDRYVLKNEFEAQGFSKGVAVAVAKKLYESSCAPDFPRWDADMDLQDNARVGAPYPNKKAMRSNHR